MTTIVICTHNVLGASEWGGHTNIRLTIENVAFVELMFFNEVWGVETS